MAMIPDDETEGFSFIWTIQNFSYCLQKKDEGLYSPHFQLYLSDTNEWFLGVFPRGEKKNDGIGVYLYIQSNGQFHIKVKMHVSILTANGTFKRKDYQGLTAAYEKNIGWGYPCFLTRDELFKSGDDAFLENDTLTLRCRILKEHPDLPVSGQCYARTVIDVKRIAFVWSIEKFKELVQNEKKTYTFKAAWSEIPSFDIETSLTGGVYCEKKLNIRIIHSEPLKKMFWTWKLSLLDADGKAAESVSDELRLDIPRLEIPNHVFQIIPPTGKMPIEKMPIDKMSIEKILDKEERYLIDGTLSLRCEFTVSFGEKYSAVEKTEYGVTEEPDDRHCSKTLGTSSSFPRAWKDNLQRFYKEGKFTDLIIRTASSKEFPVHKAILCARSDVFSAKFQQDTKENRTGVIEIEDFNDDIVSKMLLFVYTDIVEDLEWKTALELYFASDKYGIFDLKKECYDFLKDNMNCSNVCEILVKAHAFQDQDMKSAAQDFVLDHATEFINSEYWTKFRQEQSDLATETLQVLFMRNLRM